VDAERLKADVRVFHPAFSTMPESGSMQVTFLLLDWLLGEDGVERWIGSVEALVSCPEDAMPADALAETVSGLAARTSDDEWVILRGHLDGKDVLVSAMRPMKWIDRPLFDQHVAVLLPFGDCTPEGFPQTGTLDRLRAIEDAVTRALGDRALLVAHETCGGLRTLHLYSDQTDEHVVMDVKAAVAQWPGGRVQADLDPGWKIVSPFG
jgi:hypothetical protein